MAKATSLIKAYLTESIPPDGGFIITAYFDPNSTYAIYEITAYRNVKDIYRTTDGLVFKTDGNRTHMLVEPSYYTKKFAEPSMREEGKSIPYRFNEMHIHKCANNEKVMIALEPKLLYSSFTILEKKSDFFAFVFHPTEDVYVAIRKFIADSLFNDCSLSKNDSIESAKILLETIKKFSIWDKD